MRSLRTALLLVIAVTVMAEPAAAFVELHNYWGNAKTWPGSSPTVSYTLTTKSMPGVADADMQSAIAGAFSAWQNVSCSTIKFSWGGYKSSDPGTGIHVTINTNQWDPSVGDALAYATSNSSTNGAISDADVVFNAVDVKWTVSPNASVGFNDIQGVATHEIGHAIGFDHSREFEATMFFSGGSEELRTLAQDDMNGACYLYPKSAWASGKACDSCQTSTQCAGGYCLDWGGGYAFCSTDCQSSSDCGEGFSCYNVADSIPPQCIPDNQFCHQAGQNIELGEFCYGHETCASQLCLVTPDTAFCSTTCTSSCPFGFACIGGYCVLSGDTPYGGSCDESTDCETAFCIDFSDGSVCSQPCGLNGGTCPGGNQCLQDVVCVPPGPGLNGAPCFSPTQCAGTYCEDGKCTQPCSNSNQCPEGTTCTGGWCTGSISGASCQSSAECPTGLTCQKPSASAGGTCVLACNPLLDQGCYEDEVCRWRWEAWTETITGTCVTANNGQEVGEACSAAEPCELDLVCTVGNTGTPTCHTDCKIQSNNLGCGNLETCKTLSDPSDPKKGYCLGEPDEPDPVEDTWSPPDPEDTWSGGEEDVGPDDTGDETGDETGDQTGDETGDQTGETGDQTGDETGDQTGDTGDQTGDDTGDTGDQTGDTGDQTGDDTGGTGDQTGDTGDQTGDDTGATGDQTGGTGDDTGSATSDTGFIADNPVQTTDDTGSGGSSGCASSGGSSGGPWPLALLVGLVALARLRRRAQANAAA